MAKSKQPAVTDQHRLFIEKAREIGANDEVDADEVMKRLAAQKRPRPKAAKKPKTKKAAK